MSEENENPPVRERNPSIKGFKQANFKAINEFGGAENVPEGVSFYVKEQVALSKTQKVPYYSIYRVIKRPEESKEGLAYVGRSIERPDEAYIAENFGPGRFRWIGRWTDEVTGAEKGMISDYLEIDESIKRQGPTPPAIPQFAGPVGVPAPIAVPDPNAAFEQALKMFDRLSAMVEKMMPKRESSLEVADRIAEKLAEVSMKTFERDLKLGQTMKRQMLDSAQSPEAPLAQEGQGEIEIPNWLKPYMGIIEKGIDKLLGGGIQGAAAKTLLLGNDEFLQIFTDPEMRTQALNALAQIHGNEKVQKVVHILEGSKEFVEAVAKKGRK